MSCEVAVETRDRSNEKRSRLTLSADAKLSQHFFEAIKINNQIN